MLTLLFGFLCALSNLAGNQMPDGVLARTHTRAFIYSLCGAVCCLVGVRAASIKQMRCKNITCFVAIKKKRTQICVNYNARAVAAVSAMTHLMFGSMFISRSLASHFVCAFFLFTKHPHVRTTQIHLRRRVLELVVRNAGRCTKHTYQWHHCILFELRRSDKKRINCDLPVDQWIVRLYAAAK